MGGGWGVCVLLIVIIVDNISYNDDINFLGNHPFCFCFCFLLKITCKQVKSSQVVYFRNPNGGT